MKKLILLIAVVFLAFQVEAQAVKKKDVPDQVISKVETMYPNASNIKWKMDDGMYEASFLVDELKTEVVVSRDGILSSVDAEISFDQLPEAVQSYLEYHYASKTPDEIEMETDAHGIVTYDVDVDGSELHFSADGKLLSKESDDDDDEEED